MAADWIGINSSHLDSYCGYTTTHTPQRALDGIDYWAHHETETHWLILDLLKTYNVKKLRGRSNGGYDPTDVNIYVSDDKENWGAAVASGITTWVDTNDWVEVDVTDKDGRYVKIEIIDTQDLPERDYLTFGSGDSFSILDVYGEAVPIVVEPSTLALAATLHSPTVVIDCTVTPATFELAAALLAPSVVVDCTVTPDTFELALTQETPGVVVDCIVLPLTLELAATLETPTVSSVVVVTPDAFELEVDLPPPSILFPLQTVLPDTFELALTQHEPELVTSQTVFPDTFELTLTQHVPNVAVDCTVTPDTFELALTQHAPEILFPIQTVLPPTFELALTQHAPEILFPIQTVLPPTFELALTQHTAVVSIRYATIPPFMEKDLIDPFASGAWLWLVQIAIAGQSTVRIARDTANVYYDGNDFDKFNLQIGEQIFSSDGSIPRVTLRVFQDINRTVEDLINATEGALGAQVKLIRVNEKFLTSPVTALEFDYDNLASESDSEWCTFTLGIPNPLTQRYPLRNYSSSMCPWANPELFKGPDCQLPPEHEDTTCTGTYEDCYVKGNAVHWGAELGLSPSVVTKVNR